MDYVTQLGKVRDAETKPTGSRSGWVHYLFNFRELN